MTLDLNSNFNANAMKCFLGNIGKIITNAPKNLQSIFTESDVNGDGKLEGDEINRLLNEWNMGSIFNSTSVLEAVDANGDNCVSMEEIKEYAKSLGVELDENASLISNLLMIARMGGRVGSQVTSAVPDASNGDSTQTQQFGL